MLRGAGRRGRVARPPSVTHLLALDDAAAEIRDAGALVQDILELARRPQTAITFEHVPADDVLAATAACDQALASLTDLLDRVEPQRGRDLRLITRLRREIRRHPFRP